MKELLKKLAKSKTIQGITIAAIGIIADKVMSLVPAEMLAEFGPLVKSIITSTEAGGLALAWYGRMKAAGPIAVLPSTPSFDGTGSER